MGAEFLSQLQRGDLRRAAKWLVMNHGAEVLSLCRAMVRDPSTAEDLAQDVFSRAFTGLSTYREEASPRTWLMTIARHRCIDHLRRQQIQPWSIPDEPDTDEAPDAEPLPPTLLTNREMVHRGLAALDETQRALVILRYRHGMDYAELGSAFGLRPGTVRMRVSRALARMRSTLEAPVEPGALRAAPAAPPPPRAAAPAASRAPSRPRRRSRGWFGGERSASGGAPPPPPSPAGPGAVPPSAEALLGRQLRALDGPLGARLQARLDALVSALPG